MTESPTAIVQSPPPLPPSHAPGNGNGFRALTLKTVGGLCALTIVCITVLSVTGGASVTVTVIIGFAGAMATNLFTLLRQGEGADQGAANAAVLTRQDAILEEIKKVGDSTHAVTNSTHTMTNGRMLAALRVNVLTLRQLDNLFKTPESVQALQEAERLVSDHERECKALE